MWIPQGQYPAAMMQTCTVSTWPLCMAPCWTWGCGEPTEICWRCSHCLLCCWHPGNSNRLTCSLVSRRKSRTLTNICYTLCGWFYKRFAYYMTWTWFHIEGCNSEFFLCSFGPLRKNIATFMFEWLIFFLYSGKTPLAEVSLHICWKKQVNFNDFMKLFDEVS